MFTQPVADRTAPFDLVEYKQGVHIHWPCLNCELTPLQSDELTPLQNSQIQKIEELLGKNLPLLISYKNMLTQTIQSFQNVSPMVEPQIAFQRVMVQNQAFDRLKASLDTIHREIHHLDGIHHRAVQSVVLCYRYQELYFLETQITATQNFLSQVE